MTRPAQSKPMRRAGRGVITIMVALFLASGVLRLTDQASGLLANAQGVAVAPSEAEPAPVQSDLLMAALKDREDRVAAREDRLANRAQAIAVAEAELRERLVELTAAEEKLAATLALADTASETDIGRLTAVYESMKPQDAAALFQEMEPRFSAGFLARMRPEAAAAILSGLEPATAYTISVVLAGRNANAPTQ